MRRTGQQVLGTLAAALCGALAWPVAALADGAFPDGFSVLAPIGRPADLFVGTNFGLLASHDRGATWRLACEVGIEPFAMQYVLGGPPTEQLVTRSLIHVATAPEECTWSLSAMPAGGVYVFDVFADPSDGARLTAITRPRGGGRMNVVQSIDAGKAFDQVLYTAPEPTDDVPWLLESVESGRTDPRTIYATLSHNEDQRNTGRLVRSTDGGATWVDRPLPEELRVGLMRIAAVDRDDPRTVYLRRQAVADSLVITRDGGDTFTEALVFPARATMGGFLERADGTLLVGSVDADSYWSHDGGATFERWPGAPHVRGLTERAGVLYAAADDAIDGFLVGESTDGRVWKGLLQFATICGPVACASMLSTCEVPWKTLQDRMSIPDDACEARPDAGPEAPAKPVGCGCAGSEVVGLALLGFAIGRRERARRA